jgi:hypothetical protein
MTIYDFGESFYSGSSTGAAVRSVTVIVLCSLLTSQMVSQSKGIC